MVERDSNLQLAMIGVRFNGRGRTPVERCWRLHSCQSCRSGRCLDVFLKFIVDLEVAKEPWLRPFTVLSIGPRQNGGARSTRRGGLSTKCVAPLLT